MATLGEDLSDRVATVFADQWDVSDAQKVPDTDDLSLGNQAKKLDAVVLYSDLRDSTHLVTNYKKHFAAEIYKSFLYCASRVIRSEGGAVRAFDGDRVMGIFVGDSKNTNAASCGLKINYVVQKIIQPALKKQYPDTRYVLKQAVGIASSELWAARTGIRGSNDLVWVGTAANDAAQLSEQAGHATWITSSVYTMLNKSAKYGGPDKVNMWTRMTLAGKDVYRSTWWRSV